MYSVESNDGGVCFVDGTRRLRIGFISEALVRVTYTEHKEFGTKPSFIVIAQAGWDGYTLEEDSSCFIIRTPRLQLEISIDSGALSYFDSEGLLLTREPDHGGKWLTRKTITKNVFTVESDVTDVSKAAQSIDGARAEAREFESIFDRDAFEARLDFVFAEGEALYGLGSHEEGYGNLRGRSRDLYQQNMKAVVPYLVSSRGYAILFDCSSLMTFHDDAYGSYLWADVVDELDFYFVYGSDFDEVTQGGHQLTGNAPLLPKWMFGFVQSKERYVNGRELIEVVQEYRRRKVPLDTIVLDWKSWPNGEGWGQKTFDPVRFPDPVETTRELHDLGARLMVSIWPIMTGGCSDQRELQQAHLMLGNGSTYNSFDREARDTYWRQADRGLFQMGVDAWWCDCTEPFEADWVGAVKPEPHVRLAINTAQAKRYLDAGLINAYSLLHSRGIYEGQRNSVSNKRVVNLTRSSHAGQHRYATITWNGDISATWETLRRCIPEGVNFCATGEPYWTTDIGGFFIANDASYWFWTGDYQAGCRGLTAGDAVVPDANDTGCTDLGYWELYTRWLQYATFLPVFRSHGTDAPREIWRFGDEGGQFYEVIAKFIRLRYQLIPYLYSLSAHVTFFSRMMLRSIGLEFPDDWKAHAVLDEFLLGPALLVCPVTEPMYFGVGSKVLEGTAKCRSVYLPAGADWFDFWTERFHRGGATINAEAPLEKMPLYVRAGSILPLTDVMQFVDERLDADYELRVYAGSDAEFLLYEDAGDGYAYERGEQAWVRVRWNQSTHTLTLCARDGGFPELVKHRYFKLVIIGDGARVATRVLYTGEALSLRPEECKQ